MPLESVTLLPCASYHVLIDADIFTFDTLNNDFIHHLYVCIQNRSKIRKSIRIANHNNSPHLVTATANMNKNRVTTKVVRYRVNRQNHTTRSSKYSSPRQPTHLPQNLIPPTRTPLTIPITGKNTKEISPLHRKTPLSHLHIPQTIHRSLRY